MAVKFETVEDVPIWAASYFMYGDDSGLTPDDVAAARAFAESLAADGLRLVAPISGTENEFTSCPAFGAACAVQNWTAEKIGGGK